MQRRKTPRETRFEVASVFALMATACAILGSDGGWKIRDVSDYGPYRAATLEGEDTLRFYFPREGCGALLKPGMSARYVMVGNFGRVEVDQGSCDAVGVGNFSRWVRRQRRPREGSRLPRAPARFELFHEDESIILVRGVFPLAPLVHVPSGQDLVAFLPNKPECRHFVGQGTGQLQFSRDNPDVLWFGSGDARCPVLGLALPQQARP